MIQTIFTLIGFFFCLNIIVAKGYKKILWFLTGILFFPQTIVIADSVAKLTFSRIFIYTLLLTTVFRNFEWYRLLKQFPLRLSLVLLFFLLLMVGVFDERLNFIARIYRPITIFFENFFIVFLSYLYIKTVKDFLEIYKLLIKVFFIFCLYGIINYIQKVNVYYLILSKAFKSFDYANFNMVSFIERFRISSFAWHAIYYGFLLTTMVTIGIYLLTNFKLRKRTVLVYRILLLLLAINLLMVNSRTPLITLAISIGIIFVFGISLKNKIKFASLAGLLFISWIAINPKSAQNSFEKLNVFSSKTTGYEEGSSIEMRTKQLNSSLTIFNKKPITGNGIYYIVDNLGYSPNQPRDEDFFGFESYLFQLLIEQGICGLLGNALFFGSIFIYFIREIRNASKPAKSLAIVSIAMLSSFILFIVATGDLGSFTYFFTLIGINMKGVQLLKVQSEPNHLQIAKILY